MEQGCIVFAMCRPHASQSTCATPDPSARLRAAVARDQGAPRSEYLFLPPSAFRHQLSSLLKDSRDAPIAYLLFNLIATAAPAAAALFLLPPSHWLGAAYFSVLYALFLPRFLVALLHVTQHRRLFKPGALRAYFM